MVSVFDIKDSLTGGGIVGGVVTAAGILFFLYDKFAARRGQARKDKIADDKETVRVEAEALANEASEVKLAGLVKQMMKDAYEEANAARRRAHERDMQGIRAEVAKLEGDLVPLRKRLMELEANERRCQDALTGLKHENAAQSAEMQSLRAQIAALESQLRQCNVLPPDKEKP